jgi:putative flippase GtrA
VSVGDASEKLHWLREHAPRLARFCVIGGLCYGISMALFAALCELLHLHYQIAFVITFLVVNVFGYRLNGRFTYDTDKAWDRAALLRYLLVNGAILPANLVAMRLLIEDAHIWYLAATMIVAAVNAPVSFIAHRIVTYRVIPTPVR